jgi:hypothetical protein
MKINIRNKADRIHRAFLPHYERIRKKLRDIVKLASTFFIGIMFILLIQLFSQGAMKKLEEPAVGSIIGIVGIGSTAVVGFVIYFMQKKADKRINSIIESEATQRKYQKQHYCNIIINNLNEIKAILQTLMNIIPYFPNNTNNTAFLNTTAFYISLNATRIRNRLITDILEANEILLNHFNDQYLYRDLKTVDIIGAPVEEMAKKEKEKPNGSVFNGLEDELNRVSIISAIDSSIKLIDHDLIPRLKKEISSLRIDQ